MKEPLSALKHRGGKHLAHRDIHIRRAVLKPGLCRRIRKGRKRHLKVCAVSVSSADFGPIASVQRLDNLLLNGAPPPIVQRIDPDGFLENALELFPDLRQRKCNDGKAGFLLRDIAVDDLSGLAAVLQRKLLLLLRKLCRFLPVLRGKCLLTEGLHHGRPGIGARRILKVLIGCPEHRKLSLLKALVQIYGLVIAMVILILAVGRLAAVPARAGNCPVHGLPCNPGEYSRKPHFFKVFCGVPHHPLKSQMIAHLHRGLLRKRAAGDLKGPAESLREGVRHPLHRLFRQGIKKCRRPQLRLRDILAEPVQIAKIRKIRLPDKRCAEIRLRRERLPDARRQKPVAVIKLVIIDGIMQGLRPRRSRKLLLRALIEVIDLHKQLLQGGHIHVPLLHRPGNQVPELGGQHGQDLSFLCAEFRYRKNRAEKPIIIIFRENIPVKPAIQSLKLLLPGR